MKLTNLAELQRKVIEKQYHDRIKVSCNTSVELPLTFYRLFTSDAEEGLEDG